MLILCKTPVEEKKNHLIHHIFHLWVEILVIFLHGHYEGMIKKHKKTTIMEIFKYLFFINIIEEFFLYFSQKRKNLLHCN